MNLHDSGSDMHKTMVVPPRNFHYALANKHQEITIKKKPQNYSRISINNSKKVTASSVMNNTMYSQSRYREIEHYVRTATKDS